MKRTFFLLLLCLHCCLQVSALGENIAWQASIQLNWDKVLTINEVVLYDRPDPQSHTAINRLLFMG